MLTLIFSYLFSTLDQQSSVQYLHTFYRQIAHCLEDHYRNDTPCTIAFSTVCEASLTQFSLHRKNLPNSLKLLELDTTRHYHLRNVLQCLNDLGWISLEHPERRHHCEVNLECLAGYTDLLAIHPDLQDISGRLFGSNGPFQTLKSLDQDEDSKKATMTHEDRSSIEHLAVRLAQVELRLYAYDYNLHPNLAHVCGLFENLHSRRERKNLSAHFNGTILSLGTQSINELCFGFPRGQKGYLGCAKLLQIQIGMSSLNGNMQVLRYYPRG